MPERDVEEVVGSAIINSDFQIRLLDRRRRRKLLKEFPGLTKDEIQKLMEIKAKTLESFAQQCINKGLASEIHITD